MSFVPKAVRTRKASIQNNPDRYYPARGHAVQAGSFNLYRTVATIDFKVSLKTQIHS